MTPMSQGSPSRGRNQYSFSPLTQINDFSSTNINKEEEFQMDIDMTEDYQEESLLKEQTHIKMNKVQSNNMHQNFLDLQMYYDSKKFERAKDLAKHWESKIRNKLKHEIDD